jgi:hypothetical protein
MKTWTTLPEGTYITWDGPGTPMARYGQVKGKYLHVVYAEQVPPNVKVVAGRWDGPRFVPETH